MASRVDEVSRAEREARIDALIAELVPLLTEVREAFATWSVADEQEAR
jgi:hypothetical protein